MVVVYKHIDNGVHVVGGDEWSEQNLLEHETDTFTALVDVLTDPLVPGQRYHVVLRAVFGTRVQHVPVACVEYVHDACVEHVHVACVEHVHNARVRRS